MGLVLSLSWRGEEAWECFDLDVRVVVFDFMLEFEQAVFGVREEGKVDSVYGHFCPWVVWDNGQDVAFR